MTMTEIDWAARRAEFEQRLKLGHFGRPRVSTVPPNGILLSKNRDALQANSDQVDKSAALTSLFSVPKPYTPTSLDPAASDPEKPNPTQAPGLEKSRGDANYDSAPVNSSGPHDGSKGEPKYTSTSLKVNEPPILRRTSQAPVEEKENPEDLPPHLRLLATPHNASISNKTQAIESRSGALVESAAAGTSEKQNLYSKSLTRNIDQSPPMDPDEVFVPPKPKRVKPPIDWVQFLPENLRNLEKPEWMVERDAKRAEEAAKMPPPPTEQELWQEVLRRNKVAYRPVVGLPKRQSLVLELSDNEKTGGTRLTQDVARDPSRIYLDPAKATNQPVYWRWFSGNTQIPDIGEEKTGGPENDLADPNGEWIPATLEWLEREQYTTTPKQIEHMEKWIAARVAELLEAPYKVDTADPDWLSGELPASGTPKQWQDHPKDLAYRRTPIEYGSMDWNTVPTLPPMKDLYSLTPERRAQNAEASVKTFCEEWYAAKKKRMEEKEKRRLEAERDKEANEQRRAIEEAEFHKRQQLWLDFLAKFAPKANIFIRPAIATDLAQIVAIYNHYVLNTIQADELEETNIGEWRDRLYEASDDKLPFLVTVLKSNKTAGCRNHTSRAGKRLDRHPFVRPKDSAGVFSETVVGFVFAEFISTRNSMYRHAVELHLYVDPTHTRQGVGRTLMDRIMPALDVAYTSRAATDFLVDPNADRGIQWYQSGGSKEVRKIQVNVAYKYGGEKDLEWRKKFLHYWEFDQIGTMECIAEKFGEP
jgi:L-amino acid N-acyltransferase YncA